MNLLKTNVVLALIILMSCHAKTIKIKTLTELGKEDAARVIEKLKEKQNEKTTLSLKSSLKLDSKKRRVFLKELVLAKRPSSLHLTSIKFGMPLIYISIEGDKVVAYDPKGSFFAGSGTAGSGTEDVIRKVTGLKIGTEDLVELMFGSIFIPQNYSITRVQVLNNRYYRVNLSCEESQINKELLVGMASMEVLRGKIIGDQSEIEITFSNFKVIENIRYPSKIEVSQKEPFFQFVIKADQVDLNHNIDKETLKISIPSRIVPFPLENLQELF